MKTHVFLTLSLLSFKRIHPLLKVVVLAPKERIRDAVEVVKSAADDYLTYPIDPEEVTLISKSILEANRLQSELSYLRDQFWQSDYLDLVKTGSPAMQEVFSKIRSVAPTRSNVLLVGETGTGKELIAQSIHQNSKRKEKDFIALNCAAIPENLLESELFGHEKGAFTEATAKKKGKDQIYYTTP